MWFEARSGGALALVLALGCSAQIPESRFHALSHSGTRIVASTTEAYARVVRLEQAFIVASMGDDKLTVDSFRPVIEGKSFDLEPELKLRKAALRVLAKYLSVLEAFASAGDEDVDQASLELGAAIDGLMEAAAAPPIAGAKPSQVSGILAAGVDAIGREITNGQRVRALARVMDASQNDVARLADLIAASHAKFERAIEVMAAQIVVRANLIRPPPSTVARDAFYSALAATLREAEQARAALALGADAAKQIPVAHAEVRRSLDQKRPTLDALKALVEKAERAGEFYASTQK